MLTQKVMGFESEATTLVTATGDCYAGLCCTGRTFRAVGLCADGVFLEENGQRRVIRPGRFRKLYLRLTNNSADNRHQFAYSTDGRNFTSAGESFAMRAGFWKSIRVGLFCYGNGGLAQFDFFKMNVLR